MCCEAFKRVLHSDFHKLKCTLLWRIVIVLFETFCTPEASACNSLLMHV